MWQQWINFILAAWLIISNFAMTAPGVVTSNLITGIAIAVFAIWGALSHSSMMGSQSERMHRHGHA